MTEYAKADTPGNAMAATLDSATRLAHEVGPGQGLIYLLAIFCFFPQYGLIAYLARLWKEDRADARQKKVDYARMVARYQNRQKSSKNQSSPPKP